LGRNIAEAVSHRTIRLVRRGPLLPLFRAPIEYGLPHKAFDDVPDRLAFPEATPVVERSERATLHPVDVEHPLQMINFVLEYSGVPSRSVHRLGFSLFI
jgi:hypothetical protein